MKLVLRGLVSVIGQVSPLVLGAAMMACSPAAGQTDVKVPEGGGESEAAALVGKAAPEVVGEYVTGDGAKSLADAKGTVTIIDFWGTFCEPCKKSFPKLQEMVDTQAGKLAVIAVSQDDPEDKKAEDIKKFAEELKVSFPIVWDREKKTAGAYHPPKMPTTYIVGKDGFVKYVHPGYTDGEDERLAKEVEELINQ
ncbi:MAG: TlpA family protein disulfide reductase [Deltaproteobacteria bacterium]|nr:TlpA family protein disulfide reductase [Deltaproteobacteria bacterium]